MLEGVKIVADRVEATLLRPEGDRLVHDFATDPRQAGALQPLLHLRNVGVC